MVAQTVHLVRHGEVFNPAGVLYGRLPNFALSERGRAMAQATADSLVGLPVTRLIASPLLRTQQSAAPIAAAFGLTIESDDRVIEYDNVFEGRVTAGASLARNLKDWRFFVNPLRPSWGESYKSVEARMTAAVTDAFETTDDGHVVIVSHQLPIWILHRGVLGRLLAHDPRHRRCALSSVTTFERRNGELVETAYADPASGVRAADVGAS